MPRKKQKRKLIKTTVYVNGKRKYVSATSKRELERKKNEIRAKAGIGFESGDEYDLFSKWADLWLQLRLHSNLSATRKDISKYRRNSLSLLDNMPIGIIRTADIQKIIYDEACSGTGKYVQGEIKNTARQIFLLAIENRIIDFNPAEYVKIIDVPTEDSRERRALTVKEQSWIEAPTNHRGQLAAMIMLHSGLRRGELLALRWSDIDFENRTITVNKAVGVYRGRSTIKNTTKTAAGMRVVYIPQRLVDFLKEKYPGNPNALVVTTAKGKLMTDYAWRRLWSSYMSELNFRFGDFFGIIDTKTGQPYVKPKSRFAPQKIPMVIPPFTAHWLRHTYITNLYFAGVDVLTAMQQAGHADVQTTMNIYTHLDRMFKKKQINKLDEYLTERE